MIESGNQQTARLLGYDGVNELAGLSIYQFLPALPSLETLSTSRSLHLGLTHDFFVVRRDESTLPVELVLTNIELHDEPRLVLFMNDLSLHIELEEQRLQLAIEKERSDVLAKFIQDASHEFRTPLTVIKNRAFLIQSDNPDEKVRQNVQKIDTQVDRIVSLVEDLAYIAQLDSVSELSLEKHNIVDVINAAIKEFRAELDEQDITLTFTPSADLPDVCCNVHELKEALVRLINNAIRYNREGRQITVSCSHEGDEIVVEIVDSGIGIDKAYLPHIFERFYRMDTAHTTRGFGLGLAIARKLITLHHGTISVESEPNQGTTLRIIVPV